LKLRWGNTDGAHAAPGSESRGAKQPPGSVNIHESSHVFAPVVRNSRAVALRLTHFRTVASVLPPNEAFFNPVLMRSMSSRTTPGLWTRSAWRRALKSCRLRD
jgi:hypothetical protein